MQGGGYGHGVVTAAKAFLEAGYPEIGTGTLNEALALRRSGVIAPVHLCYQPDIQSARAVAHAHDVQAGSCPWHFPKHLALTAKCLSAHCLHDDVRKKI